MQTYTNNHQRVFTEPYKQRGNTVKETSFEMVITTHCQPASQQRIRIHAAGKEDPDSVAAHV